jgi:hypothetical protein
MRDMTTIVVYPETRDRLKLLKGELLASGSKTANMGDVVEMLVREHEERKGGKG